MYMISGDRNSGPHPCVTSALTTETSPRPPYIIFTFGKLGLVGPAQANSEPLSNTGPLEPWFASSMCSLETKELAATFMEHT